MDHLFQKGIIFHEYKVVSAKYNELKTKLVETEIVYFIPRGKSLAFR